VQNDTIKTLTKDQIIQRTGITMSALNCMLQQKKSMYISKRGKERKAYYSQDVLANAYHKQAAQ